MLVKPSMTGALYVVRGAGRDTWGLSDHTTKLDSSVGITGLKVKGHRRTFSIGAAGVKMVISSSALIQA
eukprot:5078349-Prymnesium_polylepis.1